MKYYCKNCGSVLVEGDDTRRSNDYEVYCPMCEDENEREVRMKPIPDYETPRQYGKRTGKEFPKEGVVFFIYKNTSTGNTFWAIDNYDYAKWYADNHPGYEHIIVIADPPVPPPDNWRPENENTDSTRYSGGVDEHDSQEDRL